MPLLDVKIPSVAASLAPSSPTSLAYHYMATSAKMPMKSMPASEAIVRVAEAQSESAHIFPALASVTILSSLHRTQHMACEH